MCDCCCLHWAECKLCGGCGSDCECYCITHDQGHGDCVLNNLSNCIVSVGGYEEIDNDNQ